MATSSDSNLPENVKIVPATKAEFIYDSPIHSEVEAKLRHLLIKLADDNKILGIQVCAYKDGAVVIETAAGVLGEDDPRPVQNDSLFLVFSVTKGITAGMLHWLVDNGKLKLDDNVARIWPGFEINKKDSIKVYHILNHTSGLHNALPDTLLNPSLMLNWKRCLNDVVTSIPETEPGQKQLYHYSSFGWLCGGIIEHASGKTFQEVLNEAIVRPLNIEGELCIGIPPGMESRVASVTPDMEDLAAAPKLSPNTVETPSTFQNIVKNCLTFAELFNTHQIREAIVPSVNGHCSARALARYYATLASGGVVPPPPQSASATSKIFQNPKIRDAFMGVGDYADLVFPNGSYGLGFIKYKVENGGVTGFGHPGLGGSTTFCDPKHNFAIAVTVNKMTRGDVSQQIVQLVCSELNVPVPHIW